MTAYISRTAKLLFAALLAIALCVVLGACQNDSASNTNASDEFTVGTKDDNAFVLKMTNSSGKSVSGISLKLPGEENHGVNLLEEGKHLANGETATIYIPKQGTIGSEYIVEIKITFNDGIVSNLHYLDLMDFNECSLLVSGKVAYVTYYSTAAKRNVSTQELQEYYYNLEDPEAAARDAAEEEEEKRRLEKLEEDLKSFEESTSNTSNASNTENEAENDEIQGANVEDDPQEFESDDREYDSGDSDE